MVFTIAVEQWSNSLPSMLFGGTSGICHSGLCVFCESGEGLRLGKLGVLWETLQKYDEHHESCVFKSSFFSVDLGHLRIRSLLFADDVVLQASLVNDLQHALERFATECEAAGMRIHTSKSGGYNSLLEKQWIACSWKPSLGVQVSWGLVHE